MSHLSLSQNFLIFVSNPAVSLQSVCPLSPPFSLPRQHLASLQPTIILALTTNSTHRAVFFLRCVREHGAEAAKGFSNVNAGRPPFVHSVYTRRPPGTGFVFGSVFYSVGTGGSVCPRDRSTNWKRKEKKTIRPAFSRAPPGRQAGARRSRPLPRRLAPCGCAKAGSNTGSWDRTGRSIGIRPSGVVSARARGENFLGRLSRRPASALHLAASTCIAPAVNRARTCCFCWPGSEPEPAIAYRSRAVGTTSWR